MSINCDICGIKFDTKRAMYAHRRWHNLPEYKEFQKKYREDVSKALKGSKMPEETKDKISKSKKGKPLSKKHRKGISEGLRGHKVSNETRKKISNSKKGKRFSEEHVISLRKAQKGKRQGSKNPNWKENDIGYAGLHYRIKTLKNKAEKCEICGEETDKYGNRELELSNISGNYRNDVNDFQWAHRSCHRLYDYENNITIPENLRG